MVEKFGRQCLNQVIGASITNGGWTWVFRTIVSCTVVLLNAHGPKLTANPTDFNWRPCYKTAGPFSLAQSGSQKADQLQMWSRFMGTRAMNVNATRSPGLALGSETHRTKRHPLNGWEFGYGFYESNLVLR